MNMHVNALERQAELEIEMQGRGALRYRRAAEKAVDGGRAAATQPGTFLVKRAVEPLKEAVVAFLADANSGKRGPRMAAARILQDMDPAVVAYLTARVILSGCIVGGSTTRQDPGSVSLIKMSMTIANALEDEQRFSAFEDSAPGLFKKVLDSASSRGTTEIHKRKVLVYAMGKFDIPWERWAQADKILLGTKLCELAEASTGMITIEQVMTDEAVKGAGGKLKQTPYVVTLTPQVTEWFNHHLTRGELLQPLLMPTVIEPKRWQGLYGGGYHTEVVRPIPMVKNPTKPHRALLETSQLLTVERGLNAIQETPWEVNLQVLGVMQEAIRNSLELPGLVPLRDPAEPAQPLDIETNPEAAKTWRYSMRDWHKARVVLRGDRLRQASLVEIAERFAKEDRHFFPHNLDFRGRAYPLPATLNPQGPDEVKGLLRFSEAIPLGTETAADWLAIHGANTFGNDKVDLEARISWVEENEAQILASAEDPFANRWWAEADKPWCFLAWCFEWAGYRREGLRFASRLPIALDGSCNGLQHYSALLRDPVGGAAVNLIPADKPQDIYQRVADRVMQKMREQLEVLKAEAAFDPATMEIPDGMLDEDEKKAKKTGPTPAQIERFCRGWLTVGIKRGVTKRPVMVLPYGGTPRSCRKYVIEATNEQFAAGMENPFGDETFQAQLYLSTMIWQSIGDVVVAAKEAMGWLQKVSRVLAKAGLPIHWTTPSGFTVFQKYLNLEKRMIKTKLHGSIIQLVRQEETEEIDVSKQALAVAPNFIHSMDASAMMMTIDQLLDDGVRSFAMIHDSYGTHAAHTEAMSQTIRQAFVRMYEGNVLEEIRGQILAQIPAELHGKIPPLPAMGNLDIASVLESDFFFA